MTRPLCPRCGSATALGTYNCFKCSYKPRRLNCEWRLEDEAYKPLYTESDTFTIPKTLVFDPKKWHIDALQECYKNMLYNDAILLNRLAYFPDEHRLFIPTLNANREVVNYKLKRLKDTDNLKYRFYGDKTHLFTFLPNKESNSIIIVEDHISGIRLQKFHNVLVLNGTKVANKDKDTVWNTLQKYDTLYLWLDSDEPGRRGTQTFIKWVNFKNTNIKYKETWYIGWDNDSKDFPKLGNFSLKRINPDTITLDPKEYTNYDIKYILTNEVINV